MSRMIPGRIRNQGIALYEEGSVQSVNEINGMIEADILNQQLQYDLEEDVVSCGCQLFNQKGYCEHLAALEYYLKHDQAGKQLLETYQSNDILSPPKESSFSSLFLDSLISNDDDTLRYRLSAHGELSSFGSEVWWTLKINRLPSDKAYVVRDIRALLVTVQKEGFYQIGKNYFDQLTYQQFDESSQQLLDFLWKLVPDSDQINPDNFLRHNGRYLSFSSGFFAEGVTYLNNLYAFSFETANGSYDEVVVKPLKAQENLFEFAVTAERHSVVLTIGEQEMTPLLNTHVLKRYNTFYLLTPKQRKLVQAISSLPIEADYKRRLFFTHDDQPNLATSLLDFQLLGPVTAPQNYVIRDFTPHFYFDNIDDHQISLHLRFDYGDGIVVGRRDELLTLPFTSHYRHQEKIFRFLETHGFARLFYSRLVLENAEAFYQFFTELLPAFSKRGVVHLSTSLQARRIDERPSLNVDLESGFLDISFDFSNLEEDDIDHALEALLNNQAYYVNKSGKLLVFDEATKRVSKSLQRLRSRKPIAGHLQVNKSEVYRLSSLFEGDETVVFSKQVEQLAQDLAHPEQYPLPELAVQATLRDYQQTGVRWLSMLDHYGFGGILADDMGLGKTLQTIAFLSSHLTDGMRVMILAPSSLIFNWQDEFHKFAPQLDVAVAHGLKPVRDAIIAENHQITITSYASFRQDFDLYRQKVCDYLILDEAQAMKNTQTKIAKRLREFEVRTCFALSGTPIENKLLEIWSIFEIVMPGLLPSKRDFLKLNSEQVARYIKPFVLRRRKEDVLPELPDLIEVNYANELADSQKAIYLAQLRQMQASIAGASDAAISRQKIEILSGITRLRQICDTPSLFMDYQGDSGKMDSLRALLLQIKDSGHRALIFSQFRGMLDKTEQLLDELGMTSYKLTGSTPAKDRQEMTKAFNNGAGDTFLISLKAGGVGLNLTGADTVVLIDLWWNPAVEMQAISRAHRLGQQRNVEVYRLITRGTIEEKILELQETKKNLVTTVLDGNETRSSMSVDDIREILGISSQTEDLPTRL